MRLEVVRDEESGPLLPKGPPSVSSDVESEGYCPFHIPHPHGRAPRKSARIMRWLILNSKGERKWLTMDKRLLIKTFGLDVPSRDMRLMGTNLGLGTIGRLVVRDNALLVSMEHVRMIIMADKVILPLEDADRGDLQERFHIFLQHILQEHEDPKPERMKALFAKLGAPNGMRRCVSYAGIAPVDQKKGLNQGGLHSHAAARPQSRDDSRVSEEREVQRRRDSREEMVGEGEGGRGGDGLGKTWREDEEEVDREDLPFELLVLEAALGEICNHLAQEVEVLSSQAQPAVEETTRRTDRETLERVRRIKAKRQRLVTRVSLVRDILEELSEDDGGMWRMCLNRQQELQQQHRKAATAAVPFQCLDQVDRDALLDVENLLESYFMLVDSTHQTLKSLGEYIDDTEDLIYIKLDSSQNSLIRCDILLSAGAFSLGIFGAVASALGENLVLPATITQDILYFFVINGLTLLVCFSLLGLIFSMLRSRRLI